MKFYICEHCGNIITYVKKSSVPVMCCGEKMKELASGINGAEEKHIPIVTVEGASVIVEVGAVEHPMIDEHHIEWIVIETSKGGQGIKLSPNQKPKVQFSLTNDEEFIAAYEYCNLHGLWRSSL
jgi:superoxide reductase